MKAIVNEIVVDLGKVINVLLKRDTPCSYCEKKIEKRKSPLFLGGLGVLHDSCYKDLVRDCAAAAKANG